MYFRNVQRNVFILLLIFLLAAPFQSFADPVQIKKITLTDAIDLALSNNLDLQSERINVELAKNDVKTANRLQNPEINIFYNFGAAGRGNPQQIGATELIEIAKRGPRKKLAQANLYKKDLDVKLREFELEMDVRETYVDLVGLKTVLGCLYDQKKLLNDFLALSQKRHNAGEVQETDVIQTQISINQLETQINSARTAVQAARNDFNKALNVKQDNPQVVYDAFEDELPGETVFIALKTPDFNLKMPPFEKIADRALEKRLDIKLVKQEIEVAKKNLVVVSRQRVPDIELMGGYGYQPHGHSDTGEFRAGAYAGANLNNIPLLYSFKPEIKNAQLQVVQAQTNYESAKNKAIKEMNSAYEQFLSSRTNLLFYKQKLIKDSEKLINISKKNYLEGKTDLTSLVVMEQSYKEIVVGYIQALTDYYTDWIDFLRTVNSEDFDLFDESL